MQYPKKVPIIMNLEASSHDTCGGQAYRAMTINGHIAVEDAGFEMVNIV
jgi:hypothetical protein